MGDVSATTIIELDSDFAKKIHSELEERGIRNYKVEISAGSSKGDNFLGLIAKVHASGFDENGKQMFINWMAKTPPKYKISDMAGLYSREIFMYEELLPLFEKFQDERDVLRPFDSYAGYIFKYPEQYSFVMENMKSHGYVMKDRRKYLDLSHAKLVMEGYGKFHALSFALRDQKPDLFKKLTEDNERFVYEKRKDAQLVEGLHIKVYECLDEEEDSEVIEKYKKFVPKYESVMNSILEDRNKYCVVGHGDSWVNNMLFKYEDTNRPDRPTEICLLDWQLSKYGSPALDLSYFIFTCTDHELRERHYEHLIKLYYYSLCKHLIDLGSDPEVLFPYSALQSELRRCSIFGLIMSITIVHLTTSEADEEASASDVVAKNWYLRHKFKDEAEYKRRIRGIVLDFAKYGYLDLDDV